MTLSALIKRDGLRELATATVATPATLEGKNGPTVATVAVADPSELEMDSRLSAEEELKIRKWFTAINETDPDIITELLERARANPKHLECFLGFAAKARPIAVH